MRRFLLTMFCCLVSFGLWAQQSSEDQPASKADVQRYMEVVHSRKMLNDVVQSMLAPMHQMLHEQYLKHKDRLPPDFEAREGRRVDEMMTTMPWDEILATTVPVYQKHFTKGDIDALVAFYSSPVGQKLLHELPGIMSDSLQATMPILQQQVDRINNQLQSEIAAMINESDPASKESSSKSN